MELSKFINEEIFGSNFKLISLMAALAAATLFSFGQTGWAAVINCSETIQLCNGTSGDDIIFGASGIVNVIHGLGGNDYILGIGTEVIYGDDGDDTLTASIGDDYINGGRGNDRID
jgi:Ca2+-binding RTX toxin-like protein